MTNFIRIKNKDGSQPERDLVVNASGVLEVRIGSAARYLDIVYDTALTATKTIGVTIEFPISYTVTSSDVLNMRKVIEESCSKPGAIPYFVSSDETKSRYAFSAATGYDKLS